MRQRLLSPEQSMIRVQPRTTNTDDT